MVDDYAVLGEAESPRGVLTQELLEVTLSPNMRCELFSHTPDVKSRMRSLDGSLMLGCQLILREQYSPIGSAVNTLSGRILSPTQSMHSFLMLVQITFVGRSKMAPHYYALERLIPCVLPDVFL